MLLSRAHRSTSKDGAWHKFDSVHGVTKFGSELPTHQSIIVWCLTNKYSNTDGRQHACLKRQDDIPLCRLYSTHVYKGQTWRCVSKIRILSLTINVDQCQFKQGAWGNSTLPILARLNACAICNVLPRQPQPCMRKAPRLLQNFVVAELLA